MEEVTTEAFTGDVSADGTTVVSSMTEEVVTEELRLPSESEEGKEIVPPTEETTEETLPSETPEKVSLIEEYTKLVTENGGDLTEEMYTELADKGYDKDTVDTIKAGVEAKQASEASAILETAGTTGEDFSKAVEWAKETWSPERVARFNDLVDANKGDGLVGIVESLMDNYNSSNTPTVEENIHSGTVTQSPSSRGYANEEAMLMDMADSRYKDTNSPYHKAVKAKVMKSTF